MSINETIQMHASKCLFEQLRELRIALAKAESGKSACEEDVILEKIEIVEYLIDLVMKEV